MLRTFRLLFQLAAVFATAVLSSAGNVWHVSAGAGGGQDGSEAHPYRTIGAAAAVAQPGDTVLVHAGVYREKVVPPRGGCSDSRRIVYRAAPGEDVTIKGSERVRGWKHVRDGIWELELGNEFFGSANPYREVLGGDWFADNGRIHHAGEVYVNGRSLYEVPSLAMLARRTPLPGSLEPEASTWTWCCEADAARTRIYADFHSLDPNAEFVEINVRDSCFYPAAPGCDYLSVIGFRIAQAATRWAAPTAEQIGAIGTNWSKGWVIEDNVVSDSKCVGITLGKDRASGDNAWSKNPSADGAVLYSEVIARVRAAGWSRETVGSHLVRHNTVFNCEQAGICGSLDAIFSRIEDNHVYNIWVKRQFGGQEIAGIKIHAAVDVTIAGNRVHRAGRGLWLDWLAQGTRVSRNLFYDNSEDDLFVEVNHGPFLVDNNLFLSELSLRDWSEGGAFVDNLFAGQVEHRPEPNRATPWLKAHSTAAGGIGRIAGGDDRFYGNFFGGGSRTSSTPATLDNENPRRLFGYGLWMYDDAAAPIEAAGNAYFGNAQPVRWEIAPCRAGDASRPFVLTASDKAGTLQVAPVDCQRMGPARRIDSALLGTTRVSGARFEQPDGGSLNIDADYFGRPRDPAKAWIGPFATDLSAGGDFRLW